MRARTLALTGFTAILLSTVTLLAVAQATKPADRRDANKDGVVSTQEKAEAKDKAEARWKAADKNKDGALSRDEVKSTTGFGNVEKNFDAMDTNKDGKVTPEERRAWSKANRKASAAPKTGTAPASGTTGGSGGGGLLPPR